MANDTYVPTVTGVNRTQTFAAGNNIQPFSAVSIADSNPAAVIEVKIFEYADVPAGVSNTNGVLTGAGLVDNGYGTYTLTAPVSDISKDFDALTFDPVARSTLPTGTIYTGFTFDVYDTTDGTKAVGETKQTYVVDVGQQPPPPPPSQFLVVNTTAGPAGLVDGTPYVGPVAGIKTELNYAHGTNPSPDPSKANLPDPSLNITAYTPGVFIVTGTGMDAIDVGSHGGGNNILDGGGDSNFLTGGTGDDIFYVDARAPTTNVWSTLKDFHSGDHATVWGVTPQDFALTWLDGQGAAGAGNQGLTGVFVAYGKPEVGITLAGFTSADLTNGNLGVSYGQTADLPGLPGSTYMNITAA